MSQAGKLEAIWIKESHRGAMIPVQRATVDTAGGLVHNADYRAERQVTLVEKEIWDRIRRVLGDQVDPIMRRANFLVSDTPLADSTGQILNIGTCRVAIRGETKPCRRMDEAYPGLEEALRPDWGAGAWGVVLSGGEVRIGDEVRWEEDGP